MTRKPPKRKNPLVATNWSVDMRPVYILIVFLADRVVCRYGNEPLENFQLAPLFIDNKKTFFFLLHSQNARTFFLNGYTRMQKRTTSGTNWNPIGLLSIWICESPFFFSAANHKEIISAISRLDRQQQHGRPIEKLKRVRIKKKVRKTRAKQTPEIFKIKKSNKNRKKKRWRWSWRFTTGPSLTRQRRSTQM